MSDGEDENREVEEILDKRLVEGKEPWYLIKWKNVDQYVLFILSDFDLLSSSNNTWEPVDHLKCQDLIQAFEEKIQNQGKLQFYTKF